MSVDVSSPPETHSSESRFFTFARPISSPLLTFLVQSPEAESHHLSEKGERGGQGERCSGEGGLVKPLGSPTALDVGLYLGASASAVSCGLFQAGGRMDDVIRGARCTVHCHPPSIFHLCPCGHQRVGLTAFTRMPPALQPCLQCGPWVGQP